MLRASSELVLHGLLADIKIARQLAVDALSTVQAIAGESHSFGTEGLLVQALCPNPWP